MGFNSLNVGHSFRIQVGVYIHIIRHQYKQMHISFNIYIHIHVCMCILFMHVHMHAYIHTYIHTYNKDSKGSSSHVQDLPLVLHHRQHHSQIPGSADASSLYALPERVLQGCCYQSPKNVLVAYVGPRAPRPLNP